MDTLHAPPAGAPSTIDGTQLVVDALKLNGLETMYGVAGIPITDLARAAQSSGIRYIGFRHESSAGHAAAISGYLTKRPGVLLTVSAPGFLNGMVALANATANCFPMIQISGSSDRAIVDLRRGDYEELDQLNAARPYAKAAYRVDRASDIGLGVARAVRTAVSGRPGGVYLDLPSRVLSEAIDAKSATQALIEVVDPAPQQVPARAAVQHTLTMLAEAQRPLIVLGKGAAYAQADQDIRDFVESTGIPYIPMSMAKGLLPDDHPQCAAAARSLVLGQADVVMLIGARLNWLLGQGDPPEWAADCRFIQVDIDPTELDSNRAIAAPLVGDIGSVVGCLRRELSSARVSPPAAWLEKIASKKQHNFDSMRAHLSADPDPMDFYSALRSIRDVLARQSDVFVVNEGANTLDFGRNVLDMHEPRKRLDPGTWGVMGVGLGYAIAAAVESGCRVVAIEGDSAFGFSGMEIETICRYGLPIVVVVFNNGGIYRGDGTNPASSDPSPTTLMYDARYDRLIEAFGGTGHHVTTPKQLTAALSDALAARTPQLINCAIDPTAGTESGHLQHLNPVAKSGARAAEEDNT